MAESPKAYTLVHTNIEILSVFELLKHTPNGNFIDQRDFQDIAVISLELNAGVFTKITAVGFPEVVVSQVGNAIVSSCSCGHAHVMFCEHQAEIIYGILERKDYRIIFDKTLRYQTLLVQAKRYGLENEPHLDSYFQLTHREGKLRIETRIKQLLPMDDQLLTKNLIPGQPSILGKLKEKTGPKRPILVMGRHRYYQQLNFLLMEADRTKVGKVKNPITNIDPVKLVWKAHDPEEIKFYTALMRFHQTYDEDHTAAELEALKRIVKKPLDLEVYYHDRAISETITAKSLLPIELEVLKAEIRLRVL